MDKPYEQAVQGLETGPQPSDAVPPATGGVAGDAARHPSVAALRQKFGGDVLSHLVFAGDEHVVFVPAENCKAILRWLRDDAGQKYDLLLDVTAVDWGGGRPLEIVYQLYSVTHKRMLRVKAALPLNALEVDTVADLWRTADWLEREVFDLFGIHFRGHPDLRRILMPENYAEGHPLRKDFPLRGRFSRAEQTRRALEMDAEDYYTPTELSIGGEPAATREGAADVRAHGYERMDETEVEQTTAAAHVSTDPALGGTSPDTPPATVHDDKAGQGRK
jgi:NADH-quinone oxidoreductase subunit C